MRKLEDWIEFMEGECDDKQMTKLGMLLKHSTGDQAVLGNLKRLRRMIKKSDPAQTIEPSLADDGFMANLHQETMKRVSLQMKTAAVQQDNLLSSDEDRVLVQESCKT